MVGAVGARRMRAREARALVARLRRLQHDDHRHRTRTYFAEGIGCLWAAVEARAPIVEIVHAPAFLRNAGAQKTVRQLRQEGVPCTKVGPDTFRALSTTPRVAGIALVLREKWTPLARLPPSAVPVHVALRSVRNLGNLGTLLRSVEAVGGGALIALGPQLDPFAPAVVRGSMGSSLRRPMVRTDIAGLRTWATRNGIRVLGAAPGAGRPYDAGDLSGPAVVLLGEERAGLAPEDEAACDAFVHLPIAGRVDSLNLGVAGSLLLYEALRRTPCRSTAPIPRS